MENMEYKIFNLEDILELYANVNGMLELAKKPCEEKIDKKIELDLLEDLDIPFNEIKTISVERIKRYQKLVNTLKKKYKFKCQICGYSFQMDNGQHYCEAHHIKYLSKNGSQNPDNVIILCPNHHKMFHYASDRISVGKIINGKRKITIDGKTYYIDVAN